MTDETPRDFGAEAQDAAEKHLRDCMEALDRDGEGEDPNWPAAMQAPFDGCDSCQIREVLQVTWPIMAEWATDIVTDAVSKHFLGCNPMTPDCVNPVIETALEEASSDEPR